MRLPAVILLASCAWGECVRIEPVRYGRVEVAAYSALGELLPTTSIDMIAIGTKKSIKSAFHGSTANHVPYGTYLVRVSAPGFRSAEREVRLTQPTLSVRFQLTVSIECGDFAELSGSIQPPQPERELWVKLVPVRGNSGTETRVSEKGVFLASGLDDGDYFLMLVDRTSIVYTKTLRIMGSVNLQIDLKTP